MAKPHKYAWNGLDAETSLSVESVANMAQRASLFLRRAGTVILAASIVLWALATYPRTHEGLVQVDLFHRLFQELPRVEWTGGHA